MNDLLKLSNYDSRKYREFFLLDKYIYIKMKVKEDIKSVNPIVTEHWKYKFEKAITILLKSGHNPNELIEQIKKFSSNIENEKNN